MVFLNNIPSAILTKKKAIEVLFYVLCEFLCLVFRYVQLVFRYIQHLEIFQYFKVKTLYLTKSFIIVILRQTLTLSTKYLSKITLYQVSFPRFIFFYAMSHQLDYFPYSYPCEIMRMCAIACMCVCVCLKTCGSYDMCRGLLRVVESGNVKILD